MAERVIGVGIVGMGFIGRAHVRAFARVDGCAVRAVCDADRSRMEAGDASAGNLEVGSGDDAVREAVSAAAKYGDAGELIAHDSVDLVVICTPTDSHVELAIRSLDAGRHVLVEKPVAIMSAEVARLRDAASAAWEERGLICMPAMCMRFWPAWVWLKQRIDSGEFGAVRSAVFQRLGCRPGWAEFYADVSRSGGALFDLHIHDADFVRWCFGAPESVASSGTVEHMTTVYRYDDGPRHVMAEGGWDHTAGFGFRMRYVVVFEGATVEFELGREPELIVSRAGGRETPRVEAGSGYDWQARAVLEAVRSGRHSPVGMDEAEAVVRMLECERESMLTGEGVRVAGR